MNYPDMPYNYALPERRFQERIPDPVSGTCRGVTVQGGMVAAITACAQGIPRHPAFPKVLLSTAEVTPVSYRLHASGKGVVYEVDVITLDT